MKTNFAALISLVTVFFGFSSNAFGQGSLVWHWDYDQTNYTVGPSDVIQIQATVVNSPSSTEHLIHHSLIDVGIDPSYSLSPYQFVFGPGPGLFSFFDQFNGLDLAPGQSFQFVWGYLTPLGGSVEPDIYHFGSFSLGFDSAASEYSSGFDVKVVPEPVAGWLVVTGFGCLAGCERRMSRRFFKAK